MFTKDNKCWGDRERESGLEDKTGRWDWGLGEGSRTRRRDTSRDE